MPLRQDCELWATFDSEDVDPSRGIVRDRSGKGRTLEASGGPTYGQSSPVGEAVWFDWTDDFFQNTDISGFQEQTTWTLIYPNGEVLDGNSHRVTGSRNASSGWQISYNNTDLFTLFQDAGGNKVVATETSPKAEQ